MVQPGLIDQSCVGTVRVCTVPARDGKVIAVRGPGDYIGEIALVDNRPRTATVIATTNVTAEVLNRAEFVTLLADAPELSIQMMTTMARRLAQLEGESSP